MTAIPVASNLKALAQRVGRVRQWLWTVKRCKVACVALGCLAGVVVLCWVLGACLDWQVAGHSLCGVAVVCCAAVALLWTVHRCSEPVTYTEAGMHIEQHQRWHRQLVTAMEFYENQEQFPYSRGLTHHLIRRVFMRSRAQAFETCLPRQAMWIYGLVLSVELLILGGFLISESVFWYHQWTPSAQASGMALDANALAQDSEALVAVTEDILTEPNTLVTFEARSDLDSAPSVRFVMRQKDPNGAPGKEVFSSEVPELSDQQSPGQCFKVQRFCESPGDYQYRFESPTAHTPWSDLTVSPKPQVQSVLSQVHPPLDPAELPEWQPLDHGRVEVVSGHELALKIRTDQPLSQIQVHREGELIDTLTPQGNEAEYHCAPEQSQSLTFTPINEHGQPIEKPLTVEVDVTVDQAPHIELLDPPGDVALTQPVPVPVTFRISDDVGLANARLFYEIKNRPAKQFDMPVMNQSREIQLSRTLTLEKWRLQEGDTVLFYVKATDIPQDPCGVGQETVSEIYLIEIQREIKLKDPQESKSSMFSETLTDALEYTRALIKKTWTLSHVKDWGPTHRERAQGLVKDLAHTQAVIEKNRDDEDMGFSDEDKAVLTRVVSLLSEAEQALEASESREAVDIEKKAYRVLRDFINESDLTPVQSPSAPKPPVPEKIKLQNDPNRPPSMNEQEAKSQLENIQKQLESLVQKQQQLKKAVEKALESQDAGPTPNPESSQDASNVYDSPAEGSAGQALSQTSSQPPGGSQTQSPSPGGSKPGQSQSPSNASQGQGSSNQDASSQASEGQGQGQAQGQGEGQSQSQSQGQGQGQGQSQSQGQGQGQGQSQGQGQNQNQNQGQGRDQGQGQGTSPGQGSSQANRPPSPSQASLAARLSMLEAKQKALQSMADQITEALDRITEGASGTEAQSSREAAQHLREASDAMDQVEAQLDQQQQSPDRAQESHNRMSKEGLDKILNELSLADLAMDESLLDTALDKQIKEAQKMADRLMRDVEAITQRPQDVSAEDMKRRLQNANRLLDTLTQAQSTVVRKTQRGKGLPSGLSLTDYQATAPSKAAQQMVYRLWSAILALEKTDGRVLERPGSVSEFWESENTFFERAASYQSGRADQ
jgi:hypothetical protein